MTAARGQDENMRDSLAGAAPFEAALDEATLLAMRIASKSVADATLRKWLGRAPAATTPEAEDARFKEAATLAIELTIFAPSLTGDRAVDRVARMAKGASGDAARASELLRRARFRLFMVEAADHDGFHRARDLATGETFALYESRLLPEAVGAELAARIGETPEGVHFRVGPILALGVNGLPSARELTPPGQGAGWDQRCAARVYRDYVRNVGHGLNFGLRPREKTVRLSCPDPELDRLAEEWPRSGGRRASSQEKVAEARALSSGARIMAALCSCLELRAAGRGEIADIYRAIAVIQIETLHERARIGSGGASPLELLRAGIAAEVAAGRYPGEALALYDELTLAFRGGAKGSAVGGDDLTRVVERIRALRAKTTTQGCTEQEALRAAEKVAELLERYGLSLSEIEMRKQMCEGFGVDTGRRKREPADRCAPAIAEFCDCRVWGETTATGTIRYVFFGLPADVEAAHYLYDLVGIAFETETAAFKRGEFYRNRVDGSQRRASISSFQIGLAGGIIDKLGKLKARRLAESLKSGGRDLVPVKASILEDELDRLGLNFQTRRANRRRKVIVAAFEQGQAAGGKFEPTPGLESNAPVEPPPV
jgi:hypothetical protein